MILLIEAFKVIPIHCVADLLHEIVIKIQVMRNGKSHSERFLGFEKMTYIRFRVPPAAGGAAASLLDRTEVTRIFLVHDIEFAMPCEHVSVARVA